MKLTPLDIRRNEFTRAFRGFNREEVESFLTMVADEVEGLVGDHRAATRRVEELEKEVEEYRQMERTLSETLISTQRASEEIRDASVRDADITRRDAQVRSEQMLDNARIEAERLMLQARRQAYKIVEDAREKAHTALEEVQRQSDQMYRQSRDDFAEMKRQIDTLVERREAYLATMRGYLTGQLNALDTLGSERISKVEPPSQAKTSDAAHDGDDVLAELDRELAEFSESMQSGGDEKPKPKKTNEPDESDAPVIPDLQTDGESSEPPAENRPRDGKKS